MLDDLSKHMVENHIREFTDKLQLLDLFHTLCIPNKALGFEKITSSIRLPIFILFRRKKTGLFLPFYITSALNPITPEDV